ncbi:MAG: aminotransferase class V-fold PLP-dependent enzyme [Pseudomonadota bacterium]
MQELLTPDYRNDFPILRRRLGELPLIYLDSGATSLKPQCVIDAVTGFYSECTANVHRSVHRLSEEATDRFEASREAVARFLNADSREIAFTRNATEALNLVAARTQSGPVALTVVEHHSNLLPWLAQEHFFLELDEYRRIDLEKAEAAISQKRPSLVTLATISNALGIRHPVEELIRIAHQYGSEVLLDLSQSVGHEPVDVFELDCDFACFSGHKMLGPSGVGVLYQKEGGRNPVLPRLLGGEMVHQAHIDSFEARPFPWGVEAGTPNIEGVIGLGAAVGYLDRVGVPAIRQHTAALAARLREGMQKIEGVHLLVPQSVASQTGIVTFQMDGMPAQGLARILSNRFAIMIRSGFHCAQPLHEAYGLPESSRASLHLYNTAEEIDLLLEALIRLRQSI